nr:luminal binding protein [Tanacetum cinerariifolium]
GIAQLDVTFKLDDNGILNVKAEDTAFGKQENITITAKKDRLSLREIARMVLEAEDYAKNDKKVKEKIDAHNTLVNFIYYRRIKINDKNKLPAKLESHEKKSYNRNKGST